MIYDEKAVVAVVKLYNKNIKACKKVQGLKR